ncbi:MAG: hypothetical protein WAT93_04290 [Pontixanthobacter sp.]
MAVFVAIVIAVAAFLQAASSVLYIKRSELAVQLFPPNGLAREQATSQQFFTGIKTEADIAPSARQVGSAALDAYARDPLTPKAQAILAIAANSAKHKSDILHAAMWLNRRDLLLQGLVLEEQVKARDYRASLATLDTILRVHPEQSANFFPILTKALAEEAAIPALSKILDRSSEWHDRFLLAASRDPTSLVNLARLRLSREKIDPELDQRLISGLVAIGHVDLAHRIYQKATGRETSAIKIRGSDGWSTGFKPFDWALADEAGFRAQPAENPAELQVFVRSGKGGKLVERVITATAVPLLVKIEHTLTPANQVKDVQLRASCPGAEQPYFEQVFRISEMAIQIPPSPSQCKFISISIYARAWSGGGSIRGNIRKFEIVAK